MVGENFQIYDVQVTKKMHSRVQKLHVDIFIHDPQAKLFSRF